MSLPITVQNQLLGPRIGDAGNDAAQPVAGKRLDVDHINFIRAHDLTALIALVPVIIGVVFENNLAGDEYLVLNAKRLLHPLSVVGVKKSNSEYCRFTEWNLISIPGAGILNYQHPPVSCSLCPIFLHANREKQHHKTIHSCAEERWHQPGSHNAVNSGLGFIE